MTFSGEEMIYKNDPSQPMLLSRYDDLLSKPALKELQKGWEGVFRRTILSLLPVHHIEEKFNSHTGRPTKELYSVCGLIIMMEYFKWTVSQARMNYMTNLGVQFALNIERDRIELSESTLQRYLDALRKKDFAQDAMNLITEKLIKELNIDITKQRLDSTHVFSNMATWSRKQLFFKIIQRFLKQVKRHDNHNATYNTLPQDLRERYERCNDWIFGETSPMKLQRGGKVYTTEEQLGCDMEKLIQFFCNNADFTNMTTYKDLVRVFTENFIDNNGKAELKPHPGGEILLNPSDREAEIGHKGVGYQVQISETCSENNDVQLITSAIPQGASQSDMASFPIVMEDLKEHRLLPEEEYADAGYGSDDNSVKATENGVKLVSPTPSKPKEKVGLDECEFDGEKRMISCPAGKRPMFRVFKDGEGRAVFHLNVCGKCPLQDKCRSIKRGKQNREFKYTEKDLRTRERRIEEATPEFKKGYPKRIPIEGLFGRLKQYTQLRRLRVRGRSAVYHTILAILAMHNIMQAARYAKIQPKKQLAELFFYFFYSLEEIFSKNIISRAA